MCNPLGRAASQVAAAALPTDSRGRRRGGAVALLVSASLLAAAAVGVSTRAGDSSGGARGAGAGAGPGEGIATADGAAGDSARSAVTRFLEALRERDAAGSYALLTREVQEEHPTEAAWRAALLDRPVPLTLRVADAAEGTRERARVSVEVTYTAGLDEVRGLVPARTVETWEALREPEGWRVPAEAVVVRALLPDAVGAVQTVTAWARAAAACDAQSVAELQGALVLGSPSLGQRLCASGDQPRVGAVRPLDGLAAQQVLVDAYGDGVRQWARTVPVASDGLALAVAVAPVGDLWRVVGLFLDDRAGA